MISRKVQIKIWANSPRFKYTFWWIVFFFGFLSFKFWYSSVPYANFAFQNLGEVKIRIVSRRENFLWVFFVPLPELIKLPEGGPWGSQESCWGKLGQTGWETRFPEHHRKLEGKLWGSQQTKIFWRKIDLPPKNILAPKLGADFQQILVDFDRMKAKRC